jgi:hypothetical protein
MEIYIEKGVAVKCNTLDFLSQFTDDRIKRL